MIQSDRRCGDLLSIVSSPTFTFYVGIERKRYHVHSKLFEDVSEPLHDLMTGEKAEALAQQLYLPNVDPLAFLALIEFAYVGNIIGTYREIVDELDQHGTISEDFEDEEWSTVVVHRDRRYEQFLGFGTEFRENTTSLYDEFLKNTGSEPHNFVVLIYWIKIATLAENYDMPDLVELVALVLFRELKRCRLSGNHKVEILGRLIRVMKYLVDNEDEVSDLARSVVFLFYVGHISSFAKIRVFKELNCRSPLLASQVIDALLDDAPASTSTEEATGTAT